MDMEMREQMIEIADTQINLCKEAGRSRVKSKNAGKDLDILLVANMDAIRGTRKSISKEMARIELMKNNTVAQELFKVEVEEEARYKGLEKLADAHGSKLILMQSIMKRDDIGEKRGY